MFKPGRIFSIQNQKTGSIEWYFQAREGNVGPYQSKKQAESMLKKFIETCIELHQTGGREQGSKNSTEALQLQSLLHYEFKGDLHWIWLRRNNPHPFKNRL